MKLVEKEVLDINKEINAISELVRGLDMNNPFHLSMASNYKTKLEALRDRLKEILKEDERNKRHLRTVK